MDPPIARMVCGYLDDLFVEPAFRGQSVVDALFTAMEAPAVERAWPVIHWTTADDNYRARSVYDQLASRTMWITFDMTVGA